MDASSITDNTFLMDVLWQTSACLGAGLCISGLPGRQPARAHGVLLACLAAAMLTPLLAGSFRSLGWGLLAPLSATAPGADRPPPDAAAGAMTAAGGLSALQLVAVLWAGLSAIAIRRLLRSIRLARRIVDGAVLLTSGPIPRLASDLCSGLPPAGSRADPQVLVSPVVTCPVIWCWSRHPRIILPPAYVGRIGRPELTNVLCHELAHWKRRDHLSALAAEILVCLLPWHPLAWATRRRLRDLSEQACDAWVLETGASPTTYARTLLALVPCRPSTGALAAAGSRRGVGRRIVRILDPHPPAPRPGWRWSVAAGLVSSLLITVAALAHRRPLLVMPAETRSKPPVTPAAPDRPALPGGTSGSIHVIPAELNLGRGPAGQPKTGSVWLVNDGSGPARVLDAKASCGCTTVHPFEPTTLAPGAWLKIEISMVAPGEPGEQNRKYVTFHIEDQPPLRVPVVLVAAPPQDSS